jgi:hypothetical protein
VLQIFQPRCGNKKRHFLVCAFVVKGIQNEGGLGSLVMFGLARELADLEGKVRMDADVE